MRVGGPADLYAAAHNVFELRALVKFARARAHPVHAAGAGQRRGDLRRRRPGAPGPRPGRGPRDRRRAARRRGRPADGEGGHGHRRRPGWRASSSVSRSRATWAGRFGPTPAPTPRTWRRCSRRPWSCRRTGVRLGSTRPASASPTARAASSTLPPGAPAEVVLAATFQLAPEDPALVRERLEEIRRWRREHQPLGIPSAGSVFRNPAGDRSAGALVDACGLKGLRLGGAVVSERHANWILNDRGGTACRRPAPRRAGAGDGRARDRRPARLRGGLHGRLDRLGRGGGMIGDRAPGGRAAGRGRRLRRAFGRARRLDRLRIRDRRRARRARPPRQPVLPRPGRGVVAPAGGPPARRPAAGRLRRPGRARRRRPLRGG